MPNEKLQGLTLEMTLDALGVQEGMKGLKRQLGVVNSEMKANLSAFDKSERSMKQYETRLEGLNNKLTVQKKMHEQAKQELDDLNNSYKKAGTEVKKIESELSKLTNEHKKNDDALKKSNDALKSSNAELKKAESQYKRTNTQRDKAYQRLKELRQAEKDLKNSGEATNAQLKRASAATQKQSQKHKELVQRYKEEEQQVKKLKNENNVLSKSNDKITTSYKKTEQELKQSQTQHKKLNKEIQDYTKNQAEAIKKINSEKTSLNNLERAIEKTSKEMKLFNREQALANSSFTKTAEKFDKMSDSFGRFGMGMQSVGRNMSMYVTTPVVGALGASTKAVIDFDSAMAGVNKTVDLSASEYKKMSNDIVNMSKKLPVATTDIAAVAESAGQLGIKKSAILDFTKTVIDLGESTNLTREQAATEFARFANIVDMPQKSFDRLGSSIVALGNTTATTESEIMSMSMRIAAQGKLVNMSESDITALAATMSSLGIEAEAGGTAMTTVLKKIDKAVGKGGKEIKAFSDASGVSAKEFKEQWENDPIKALDTFIGGLSESKKEGKNLSEILADLGIKGIRESDTVLRMANNHKLLGQSVKTSGKAWKENKALEKEANQRYKTMASQIQVFKNQLVALGIDIGNHIAPTVVGITKTLGRWTESFQKLPKPMKSVSIGLGLIAAATGPVLLATGLLIRGIGSAMKGYAGLNRVMAKNSIEAGVNATAHSAAGTAMMTTNSKNAKGLTRLTNMIGLTGKNTGKLTTVLKTGVKGLGVFGLAVTAVAGVLTYAYKNIDWFRDGVQNLGTLFKQIGDGFDWSWIKSTGDWFKKAGSATKDFATKLLELSPYMQLAKLYFSKLDDALSKSSDTVDLYSSGVSKGTKKALSKYTDLSEKARVKLEEIRISHQVIGNAQYKDITDLYESINKEVQSKLEERHKNEISTLTKLFNESDALSDKREQEIISKTKKENQREIDDTVRINQQIQDIVQKAKEEKRALTEQENEKIAKLQTKLDKQVTGSLSESEKEQKVILERMKTNQSALSIQAASNVIKDSAKARDKSIGDAKKKRDDVIKWAIEQRDVSKNISKEEAKAIIDKAEEKYKESKKNAELQHSKVVKEAQKQNKGVKTNIDSQNGHVLSSWEKTKNKVGKHAGKMAGTAVSSFIQTSKGATKWLGKTTVTAVGKFKSISKGAGDWLGRTTKTATSKFTSISGSASKWLGKTYTTAKDKFMGVWKQGREKFTLTASKVGEKTKSAYKSASKWFGNTYKNAKSNFTDMWGSARKNFNSISSHGWSKAKSTYKGFKSWLDRTLKYIRNIGSDMGRAAADLGIKVANNAITGLNRMINGINKISTAITGESLIKSIDPIQSAGTIGRKLSTGTTSSSVATDSEGGLKQATMAIVNDKGPGNGTGGFTQEIIERKDGSMYMPKGKDVPVFLNQGDKVHSGGVTQQLDQLGLLPRFSTGTPKKRLDEKIVGAFGKLTGKTVSHGAEALDGIGTIADDVKGEVGKQVGKASAFVSKSVKDVWDFMEKPKELIKRVMGDFGVDFKGIPAHTGALVRGAYKKLKSSLADKVASMFDEFGSSGGGYNPFANWPITPGRGWSSGGHAGIDYAVPGGTKIPSPIDGEVIQRWFSPFGGGNETQVYDGSKYTHIFMHQSKQIAKKGQRISQGDIIGLVGNTGNSFGDHLHWQVNKGKGFRNNHPDSINPLTWVKEAMANGGGSKNKGASAWRGDIIRAARQMGVSVTGSDISNIISLINAESSGNANAVQSKSLLDINTLMGNPAQGLLQYIPQTFRHYAVKGHTNIRNGYDQLLAFFNNKYWRSQFNPNGGWSPSGPRRKYANGGISSTHKIAEISENNKAEAIVPLTKRTRAIQLTEQIMDYLGMDVMKPKVTVNNDTSMMEKLLKQIVVLNDRSNRQTDTIIQLIRQIPKGTDPKNLEPIISSLQGNRLNNANYTMGGAR
ncbi:phage tail tape measure protein [Mammaliicoccus sciuri]|uniref:phage tail tape measure protein n=1 Tax=Mammaliicoccus sciuri TaxID=1296 RepID=UPI000CD24695|nr:phage tail tape measure protein [Mammaliicoccus sciuri]PNZ25259.1 phage tail tape measure protein [Mammaliicoccus sciuri]